MAELNTANVGFEKQIWDAACILRGNMDASEYKQVVLGLIFLKYMELIENGVSKVPDEIGYELRSEQYGVLGYEAEMVWREKKIALLLNNDDVEAVQKFIGNGWKVYTIGVNGVEKLAKELR